MNKLVVVALSSHRDEAFQITRNKAQNNIIWRSARRRLLLYSANWPKNGGGWWRGEESSAAAVHSLIHYTFIHSFIDGWMEGWPVGLNLSRCERREMVNGEKQYVYYKYCIQCSMLTRIIGGTLAWGGLLGRTRWISGEPANQPPIQSVSQSIGPGSRQPAASSEPLYCREPGSGS